MGSSAGGVEPVDWDRWINEHDEHGKTPLHYACAYGHDPVVKLLLGKGANVAAVTNFGVRFCPLRIELELSQ